MGLLLIVLSLNAGVLLLGDSGNHTTHDPVVEAVAAYVDAVVRGEGEAACGSLTQRESRAVLREVRLKYPESGAMSCPEAYSKASKALSSATKERLLAGAAALRFEQGTIRAKLKLPGLLAVIQPIFIGDQWWISEGLNLKPMWLDLNVRPDRGRSR